MIGIYLLVTIFTQFSPQNLWMVEAPAEISVEFERLNGVQIGAPVLVDGQLIGSVSSIVNKESATQAGITSVSVQLKIAPRHRTLVRRGTIALLKHPMSTSRVHAETVLELLLPNSPNQPLLGQNDAIVGYSSFEEFWSADFTRRGIDEHAFEWS